MLFYKAVYFAHLKSHMDCPGIEPGRPRQEVGTDLNLSSRCLLHMSILWYWIKNGWQNIKTRAVWHLVVSLDSRGMLVRFLAGVRNVSFFQSVHTGSYAHPRFGESRFQSGRRV
jgi:hypothetical protein